MKKFSVKHANQLGQDKKYDELYAYVKPYIKDEYKDTNADALAFWAICYDFGYGMEQNRERAILLYQYASNQGSLIGMFHYAYYLMQGYENEDEKESDKLLFEKLSKKGMPEAMFYLAVHIEGDIGLKLLKQAAKKNYIPALILLGKMHIDDNFDYGIKCYKKAIELGSCEAKFELALCYRSNEQEEYIRLMNEVAACDSKKSIRSYHEKFCYLNVQRQYYYELYDYSSYYPHQRRGLDERQQCTFIYSRWHAVRWKHCRYQSKRCGINVCSQGCSSFRHLWRTWSQWCRSDHDQKSRKFGRRCESGRQMGIQLTTHPAV